MPNPRARYPEEFKAEAVQLVRSYPEKSISELSRELGLSDQTLHNWVKQAQIDHGEREELRRLRKEVRILREEREILKKAAVDSTGQCNTVGFLVLSGSEVWVWLIWVVRGCRQHARRSFGIGGRPESPLATSPGRCRRLLALFTGYSKPPAESLHPADVGQGGYSL